LNGLEFYVLTAQSDPVQASQFGPAFFTVTGIKVVFNTPPTTSKICTL